MIIISYLKVPFLSLIENLFNVTDNSKYVDLEIPQFFDSDNSGNLLDLRDSDLSVFYNIDKNQTSKSVVENSPMYSCDNCLKCYRWKSHLSRHVKFECGKAPMFECPHCFKRFSQKNNLKRHVLTLHFTLFMGKGGDK